MSSPLRAKDGGLEFESTDFGEGGDAGELFKAGFPSSEGISKGVSAGMFESKVDRFPVRYSLGD